jgi:DNA-directed RNA polymerase I, II, and III subunit RPABC2
MNENDDFFEVDRNVEYENVSENEDDDEEYEELEYEEKDEDFKILTYKNILENIQKNPKKTLPMLTKFEKARIVGVRLQQLAYGARPLIDTSNCKNIEDIVNEELKQRKIPFIIRRTLPNGVCEDWKLEEFDLV